MQLYILLTKVKALKKALLYLYSLALQLDVKEFL